MISLIYQMWMDFRSRAKEISGQNNIRFSKWLKETNQVWSYNSDLVWEGWTASPSTVADESRVDVEWPEFNSIFSSNLPRLLSWVVSSDPSSGSFLFPFIFSSDSEYCSPRINNPWTCNPICVQTKQIPLKSGRDPTCTLGWRFSQYRMEFPRLFPT